MKNRLSALTLAVILFLFSNPGIPEGADKKPVRIAYLQNDIHHLPCWVALEKGFYAQEGLAVVAVNVGDGRDTVASYARDNGLTFAMLTDERGNIFRQYGAIGFPTVFIIDRHGVIRQKVAGEIRAAQLEQLIKRQFTMQEKAEEAYEKSHRR